ncbi:glutamate racemase [Dolosicoccus paucivorans]|nr:glutamate racemase [Dolosicoccus paucivorans]
MKNLPIGYIDSGVGGLTVVKESLKQLPNESILYLGDNARCPYGPRSAEEVKQFTWQMVHFLLKKGIKMLVIACNTATVAALKEIQAELSIPVIGVVQPGSKIAAIKTKNNKVGVIGTTGTIENNAYQRLINQFNPEVEVFSKACPPFVEYVERNEVNSPETFEVVEEYLTSLLKENIDTLVLGCTHYPLLEPVIQHIAGPSVTLVDSGVESVVEVSKQLERLNLKRSDQEAVNQPATRTFYTTGSVSEFSQIANEWFNNPNLPIQSCIVKGDEIIEVNHRKS